MQTAVDVAQDSRPLLTVRLPPILHGHGRVEIDVSKTLEANAARSDVPRALGFVEFKQHDYIV